MILKGNSINVHCKFGACQKWEPVNQWKTNQAKFFAFDKFTLQNLANKSGCV